MASKWDRVKTDRKSEGYMSAEKKIRDYGDSITGVQGGMEDVSKKVIGAAGKFISKFKSKPSYTEAISERGEKLERGMVEKVNKAREMGKKVGINAVKDTAGKNKGATKVRIGSKERVQELRGKEASRKAGVEMDGPRNTSEKGFTSRGKEIKGPINKDYKPHTKPELAEKRARLENKVPEYKERLKVERANRGDAIAHKDGYRITKDSKGYKTYKKVSDNPDDFGWKGMGKKK